MPILHRGADKVMEESVKLLDASYRCSKPADFNNACTDVGDLTHLFPVLNFTFGGFAGKLHGADFKIMDEELAYIKPAKLLALTTYRLLCDQAKEAKKSVRNLNLYLTKKLIVSIYEIIFMKMSS